MSPDSTTSTLSLQPITAATADRFKIVRLRALRDAPSAFGSTYTHEASFSDADWQNRAAHLDGSRSIGFLASDQSDPCGVVAGFLDSGNATVAHLVSMWVAPTHRGQGVTMGLVEAIVDWGRSKRVCTLCLMVTSNNYRAIRFYKRMGFAMTGRSEPYPNDPKLVEYEMSCRIDGDRPKAT